MAIEQLPNAETLGQLIAYTPETGKFVWRHRAPSLFDESACRGGVRSAEWAAATWNTKWAGKEAFTATDAGGYKVGSILGKLLKAHRVAWVLVTGEWPNRQIDHINGQRDDNRISNLRLADDAANRKNMGLPKDNKSGVIGVSWDRQTQRWRASIRIGGKTKSLGRFATINQAVQARLQAEAESGFDPMHGKRTAFAPGRN